MGARVIRRAVLTDLPRLGEMGSHFREQTSYAYLADDPAQRSALIGRLITGGDSVVLADDEGGGQLVGMIGLVFFSHPISGEPLVSEVFWWLEPEYRRGRRALRLLQAAETWARDAGAVRLQMVAPNATVARLYEVLGYTARETLYERGV